MRVTKVMFLSGMSLLLVGSILATWLVATGAVLAFISGIALAVALEERDYAGIAGLSPGDVDEPPVLAPALAAAPDLGAPHAA